MTDYFVGSGGNDGNDGLSWANRFLTLNGAEDEPVAAADTVYVGKGVYRETLTIDVSGTAGNPITYIGDVTGENTDGVGGIVRITGSDNDQTGARGNCITVGGATRNYRSFRGFAIDTSNTSHPILNNGPGTNWTIEDCVLQSPFNAGLHHIYLNGAGTGHTIKRCLFIGHGSGGSLGFNHSSTVDDAGHIVENCLFIGGSSMILTNRVGGIAVRNCTFVGRGGDGVLVNTALTIGQQVDVNNCIFAGLVRGVKATTTTEIVENYNAFHSCSTNRTNTDTGGNSVTYPPLFLPPIFNAGAAQISGFKTPWWFGELSEWSQIAAITGSNEPTEDLHGIVRPTTAAKNSWGPIQFHDVERETGTVRTGSVSIALHDAGVHQIFVPVTAVSTIFSVYVYREADYTGTNPRLVVKQPGQADDTTTDAAASGQWNELTTTLTPDASTDFVIVELQSLNTAAATNFDVFFDDLTVT